MGTIGGSRLHAGLLATPEGLLARLKNTSTDGATQPVSTVIESIRVDGELRPFLHEAIEASLAGRQGHFSTRAMRGRVALRGCRPRVWGEESPKAPSPPDFRISDQFMCSWMLPPPRYPPAE